MKHRVLGLTLALVTFAGAERAAEACGGCFAPPEFPTVVTDHRMLFSVSRGQSTLYDQIRYQGAPQSFAWVLPYSGEIEVGVSSDALFNTIDAYTQTVIQPPPLNCPARPANCPAPKRAQSSPDDDDEDSAGSVEVLKREVVGPYDTVQLKAGNPKGLIDWLTENGYALPDDVKPVVAAYQGEHFNFLALKLVPGKGVQDMLPIRVSTKGTNVALPLRMVAAGAGAKVGITLWVVAEGRYEPQNFGSFFIGASELTWDWTQQKSNYVDLRAKKTADGGGRVWEVESSVSALRTQIESSLRNNPGAYPVATLDGGASDAGQAPTPAEAEQAQLQAAIADIGVLFAGIAQGAERITRIRADLDHAGLDHDLVVQASGDQSPLATQRQVTREVNEPQCPVFNGCTQEGTAPRSKAIAKTTDNSDDGCTTTPGRASSAWMGVGLGALALVLGRALRRRS